MMLNVQIHRLLACGLRATSYGVRAKGQSIKKNSEFGMRNSEKKNLECGLRPVGAIGACAPEGSQKRAKPMEPGNKLTKKLVF